MVLTYRCCPYLESKKRRLKVGLLVFFKINFEGAEIP